NNESNQPDKPVSEKSLIKADSSVTHKLKTTIEKKRVKAPDPNAMEAISVSNPTSDKKEVNDPKPEENKKIPKAVMPKKDEKKDNEQ
ncbi:MAG: hypothetical protein JJE22_08945, partial [Bacteroidia bacterium]|nr:hypothetical protein [Bacteroidia bacterium]